MTLVIVKRQGDDVIMLADTMIGDVNATSTNVIPGRLKLVTIAPRLTIAFAGSADPASVAIKHAQQAFLNGGRDAALAVIKQDSQSGLTDYIVVSHDSAASVRLIRNGGELAIDDICAIGCTEPFQEIINEERLATPDPNIFTGRLRTKFMDALLTGKHVGDGIGGFPMAVEATREHHRYRWASACYTYKLNMIWGEETEQPWEQVESGDGHYQFSILTSKNPDVPVVGACLLQAKTGFVYSPLEQPEPFVVRLLVCNGTWEGRDQEMYATLTVAIEEHIQKTMLV